MVDSLVTLRLYDVNETSFTTNGIGSLKEAISCIVTEERNGEFTLEMEYPATGSRFYDLQVKRIIYCRPNAWDPPQAFRIYEIEKPIDGIAKITAAHISYDLSNWLMKTITLPEMPNNYPSRFSNPATWFNYITTDEADDFHIFPSPLGYGVTCPFTMTTDIDLLSDGLPFPGFERDTYITLRSFMGSDGEDSLLSIYNGEFYYDNFNIQYLKSRGSDNGVTIRYGKNLTDLKMVESDVEKYNAVLPFWASGGVTVRLSQHQPLVFLNNTQPDFIKPYLMDLSEECETSPSVTYMRNAAEAFLANPENIGTGVSIKVSFIELSLTEDYKDYAVLEETRLCDTVTVYYPILNVNVTTKVVKTVYDVLANRYNEIELGEVGASIVSDMGGLSGSSSNYNAAVYINSVVSSNSMRITKVKRNSDTSISITAVGANTSSSSGDTYQDDTELREITNTYIITTDSSGNTIFTNTTNNTTITFEGWDDES